MLRNPKGKPRPNLKMCSAKEEEEEEEENSFVWIFVSRGTYYVPL